MQKEGLSRFEIIGIIAIIMTFMLMFFLAVIPTTAQSTCLPSWDRNEVYTSGDQVSHNGTNWRAKWWTTNEEPGTTGEWGVWEMESSCIDNPTSTPPPMTSTPTCPVATPEYFEVRPVTSPTNEMSQTLEVYLGRGEWVSATGPGGSVTVHTPDPDGYFRLTIPLVANSSNEIEVVGKVETVTQPNGCVYGGYTLTRQVTIVQEGGETATATPDTGSCAGLPQYVAGTSYITGQDVQNVGNKYSCDIAGWCSSDAAWAYEPGVGQYWQTAWSLTGSCGNTSPTPTNTPVPPTATPDGPTPTPSATPDGGSSSCPVQSAPTGKVLVGYWETWDGSSVHPGMGHIPITESHSNFNVINVAFPVLLADGTMVFEDGMAPGEDVPTPAEICAAKAQGRHVLLSIGGAAAGIDLTSRAVAQQFVDTAVPILQEYNFDGIDIDIEAGLVAGSSWSQNSVSQDNLIYIIDSILAQMPSNFMLTMTPETAYVTGGQIAYGGPWGAYLPIIQRYLDNGRLNWLQMQYYNGSFYGCPGGVPTSYNAGTVVGFVEQTKCMANGFQVMGGPIIQIPYSKMAPGLPAQEGAGGGYMSPIQVQQAYSQVSNVKGLMTWSINWDGSQGWTFATNNKPQ